ncbi:MAG: hypothetical protein ABFS56_17550 [Pseudomonadota bacterium]
MSLEKLDNLVKIGQLKTEPPDQNEFDGMIASAKARLQDSKLWCSTRLVTRSHALAWLSLG